MIYTHRNTHKRLFIFEEPLVITPRSEGRTAAAMKPMKTIYQITLPLEENEAKLVKWIAGRNDISEQDAIIEILHEILGAYTRYYDTIPYTHSSTHKATLGKEYE